MKPYALLADIWKPVPGYEGRYEVSNSGLVKSLPNARRSTEILLRPRKHIRSGHLQVTLTSNEGGGFIQKTHWVHRIVLLAFVGAPGPDEVCCHNDGNPENNSVSNLRWDTQLGNSADRLKHGTHAKGEQNPAAKVTESQVRQIKALIESGASNGEIATLFPLTQSAVKAIRNGYNWSFV